MAIQPESFDVQIKRGLKTGYSITPQQQQAARERLLKTATVQAQVSPLIVTPVEPSPLTGLFNKLQAILRRWNTAQDDWERSLLPRLNHYQHCDRLRFAMSWRFMSIAAIV